MNLSTNFTLEELTFSHTAVRKGISNVPSQEIIANLERVCFDLLEPLRAMFNAPIIISSGYRSVALNKAIGGAKNSQHIQGEAVDFTVKGMTVQEVYEVIKNSDLVYRQNIQEFSAWVHLSVTNGDGVKRQNLKAVKNGKKTIYIND